MIKPEQEELPTPGKAKKTLKFHNQDGCLTILFKTLLHLSFTINFIPFSN